jgi:UDPglucose--hexose-1-phosphate uridylyltransferase
MDFVKKKAVAQRVDTSSCPFCPGNERMTPPAVLVYLKSGRNVVKKRDTDGVRYTDWLIRCVPNLFSAFSPPENEDDFKSDKAVGHHEVLVESPNHVGHPAVAKKSQLANVVRGYVDRLEELSQKPYVKYVSIFRNHGLEAGASLSHAHSQIIAMPMIPSTVNEELRASKEFYEAHGECFFCDLLRKEKSGPRFFWENRNFTAFASWAGINPFEFWVVPKSHQGTLLDMKSETVEGLAEALKTCLGALRSLLNDPPYNYGFHVAPTMKASKYYHWHLEVYPKLSIWAGFEKNTGVYINVVPPEDAAQNLKDAITEQ